MYWYVHQKLRICENLSLRKGFGDDLRKLYACKKIVRLQQTHSRWNACLSQHLKQFKKIPERSLLLGLTIVARTQRKGILIETSRKNFNFFHIQESSISISFTFRNLQFQFLSHSGIFNFNFFRSTGTKRYIHFWTTCFDPFLFRSKIETCCPKMYVPLCACWSWFYCQFLSHSEIPKWCLPSDFTLQKL